METRQQNINTRIGLFWAILNAFLWGTTFICSRYLMKNHCVDPLSICIIRFSGGAAILFLLGTVFYRDRIFKVSLKDVLQLSWLGALGLGAMNLLIFTGQQRTTAINAALIIELSPVMILLLGLGFGEKLHRLQYIGAVFGFIGCLMAIGVISEKGFAIKSDHIHGDLLLLLAAVCWAFYVIFSKKITDRLGAFVAISWIMLTVAIELFILRFIIPHKCIMPNRTDTWMIIIYLIIFPTAVAYFAWSEATARLKLSLLNITQYLTPVFTIILAWMLLGESMSLISIIGACMVLGGVALTASGGDKETADKHPMYRPH
ncbi:EamA family transporter [Lentisphaerota bacterium ZTH]|nr:EamA family transporter [Lentisphaerota bacterium]WET05347.1 EamA family transporter [Lentisphaerota bacterium ZTH]